MLNRNINTTLSIFFILLAFIKLNAQNLSAKVIDESDNPLVGATIYFNGTTTGVITNMEGIFNIKVPDGLEQPVLVITYLGYKTKIVQKLDQLENSIQLMPAQESLNAINLYTSPFARKEMKRVFSRYFLGTSKEARNCEILNFEDVRLYYVSSENTLYAESSNPLIIKNDYLGYKINFNLENFEVRYNTKSLDHVDMRQNYYAGYTFFEDINPNKEHNRIKTYLGSKEHFFRTLITGQISQSKFKVFFRGSYRNPDEIFNLEKKTIQITKISLKDNILEKREDNNPLEIIVKYKREFTTLKFLKSTLLVDNFGNDLDFKSLFLTGEFANYKVARTLPSNFSLVGKQ